MGNSPSSHSPLTSEATGSSFISRPRALGRSNTSAMRPGTNSDNDRALRDSESVDASAPPPYTPVAQPQDAVSMRDTPYLRNATTSSPTVSSHRRTTSHPPTSHPVRHGHTQTVSAEAHAPGDGVGGFISPSQLSPGSNFTRANSTAMGRQDESISGHTNHPNPTSRSASRGEQTQTRFASSPPVRRNSKENALEMLRRFDTVIIVDDSSSMEGALWIEARDALGGIADAAARHGAGGIDLYFLNDRRSGNKLNSAVEVNRLFDSVQPMGITPTGEKLEELLLDYLLRLETSDGEKPKPVNFVILTDGAPTDDPESVIVTAAKRLDAIHAPISQVGIQFVQLGSDPGATQALEELDDELANKHNIRDMVDTTLYTGQQLTTQLLGKILLGGVNRRVDNKGFNNL